MNNKNRGLRRNLSILEVAADINLQKTFISGDNAKEVSLPDNWPTIPFYVVEGDTGFLTEEDTLKYLNIQEPKELTPESFDKLVKTIYNNGKGKD